MTYGPPPNQGRQQPPPNQGWQQPPPQGFGPPGYGPPTPAPPPIVVVVGIVAILWSLLTGVYSIPQGTISGLAIKAIVALIGLVGGIMLLARQQAGAVLLVVAGGLNTLSVLLGYIRPLYFIGRPIDLSDFDLEIDGVLLLQALIGIGLLVLSLLPVVGKAFAHPGRRPGPPPPGHGPSPGYGPPPPPNWRQ